MYYVFLGITLLITLGAQSYLDTTFKKCDKMKNKKGIIGKDVARTILDSNDLKHISLEETPGYLSDHYDSKNQVIRLSSSIYKEDSVAALSVAAHECGHAIQDKNGYFFLRLRHSITPIVNFVSFAGYIAVMIGLFAAITNLIWIGIICEMVILSFQLITLPVEFNASRRGLKQIQDLDLVSTEDLPYCRRMLKAAALTYVAATATAAMEVLRLVLMVRRRD